MSCISANTVVDDNTEFGTQVTFLAHKDALPPPKDRIPGVTFFGKNCRIEKGAKIMIGIKVGDNSKIGAGSTAIEDVPEGVTVCGNPAEIHNGWGGKNKVGFV
jgi:acetyltransferase-like isoleucine patch superfamily enzyme